MESVLIIIIILSCVSFCFYNIYKSIYAHFNHYGWAEDSTPDKNAKILDITSKEVQYGRTYAKIKTKITFSDGFYFITYKNNRETSLLTYKIYLSEELKQEIISLAIEQHNLAVDKFKSIDVHTFGTKNQKDIMQIKIEIVNDKKYIKLKSKDRIEYLNNIKKQTVFELNNLTKALKLKNNKIKHIPVDIAKHIKSDDISLLKKDILRLENKRLVLDELIALEINDKHKKKEYEVLTKKVLNNLKDKEDNSQYWDEWDD